tara:strand:+ start:516 stop:1124 length:609 start_codon:yes stop_codon:yes gene_type:complete
MVIGISGKIRSGKSRVAKTIIEILEENGKTGVVKSFAQPLYEIISEMYDNDIETIKRDKQDKVPIYINTRQTQCGFKISNYREILQIIGTGGRNYGDIDIWVNALFGVGNEKVLSSLGNNKESVWVIEDLRFPNEAKRIRECNGLLIRVEREKHQPNAHIIENSLNNWQDWDLVIKNDFDTKKKRNKGLKKILKNYLTGVVV